MLGEGKGEKMAEVDRVQREVITKMFDSTIDTETADLLSRTQIEDQNESIQRLLRRLGEANRDLIEAVEADEKKHTVKRG